jgi:hypothetical protein
MKVEQFLTALRRQSVADDDPIKLRLRFAETESVIQELQAIGPWDEDEMCVGLDDGGLAFVILNVPGSWLRQLLHDNGSE